MPKTTTTMPRCLSVPCLDVLLCTQNSSENPCVDQKGRPIQVASALFWFTLNTLDSQSQGQQGQKGQRHRLSLQQPNRWVRVGLLLLCLKSHRSMQLAMRHNATSSSNEAGRSIRNGKDTVMISQIKHNLAKKVIFEIPENSVRNGTPSASCCISFVSGSPCVLFFVYAFAHRLMCMYVLPQLKLLNI